MKTWRARLKAGTQWNNKARYVETKVKSEVTVRESNFQCSVSDVLFHCLWPRFQRKEGKRRRTADGLVGSQVPKRKRQSPRSRRVIEWLLSRGPEEADNNA